MKIFRYLWALLLIPAVVFAEDITVRAKGIGPTREAATRAACRTAIEQGIGQVITSSSVMNNYITKKDEVITRTEGYVKTYQVLSEAQGPDGAWTTEIEAVVNRDGLQDELSSMCFLVDALGKPRVAVLLDEEELGERREGGGPAESELITYFQKRCFEVVEPGSKLRASRAARLGKATKGDMAAATAIGAELGAELVLTGSVVATEGDVSSSAYFHGSGMKQASARLSLKLIDVSTHEILASRTGTAPMVDASVEVAADKAAAKAVQKVLDGDFTSTLLQNWQHKANDGQLLSVQVEGIPDFAASQKVLEELRTHAVTVNQRKLENGRMWIDVIWRGTVTDFCSSVDQMKINDDENSLEVKSTEGNTVILTVK